MMPLITTLPERKIFWVYRGHFYKSEIDSVCPLCRKAAVIALPPELRAEQTDGTTHVCHPAVGGCNHGRTSRRLHATRAS
jgi:hypothetical protein